MSSLRTPENTGTGTEQARPSGDKMKDCEVPVPVWSGTLRAFLVLFRVSFTRLLWSINTLMVLFPIVGCALFILRRRFHLITPPDKAFDSFGSFVLFVFSSFLIPICALAFGTTALGAEREEQTLVFLLTRPIPRWQILFAKILATIPLSCGMVLGSFVVYCQLAGTTGHLALRAYWPVIFCMTLAYLALFHLFAVAFRHPTMLALVYALFMELFVANLPGSIKRFSINYYGRSLLYSLGSDAGLKTAKGFDLIPISHAYLTLAAITSVSLLVAFVMFQWKEFRDVS